MTALEGARQWRARDFWVIPVPYRQKKPDRDEWQNLRLQDEADLAKHFASKTNVGVLLGEPRGNSDVDLDITEAIAAWPELGPSTKLVYGRQSKRRSHHLYRCWPPVRTAKYEDAGQVTLVELRGLKKNGEVGLQSIAPPSVHPSGEAILFEPGCDGEPAAVDGRMLQLAVARTAAAALLARHWPAEQAGRHDAFLALGGMLVRAGWSLGDAQKFVRAIYRALWPPNPDFRAADLEVETSFRQFKEGGEVTGYPTLAEKITDPKVMAKVTQWLNLHPASQAGGARAETALEWPAPVPLENELPPVEAFIPELLPESFRALALDIADRLQVPLDLPAIVATLCLAGAVNRRARIHPKVRDTGWLVVPNLWGGLIALPGFLKSPVIQIIIALLLQIQAEWRREYENDLEYYTHEKEAHEIRLAVWKSKLKEAAKESRLEPFRPPEPGTPVLRRLVVNDATFEALHQTMSANPAGILLIRDELTGWWSMLDRPGREGERAFCLQSWNGDTSHTIDRIGRGSIHVEACCLSLLGGIQPGRLRSYLVDALKDGPSNDGLIQRFQLLVWPDTARGWSYVDRPSDAAAEDRVRRVFAALTKLDAESPREYHFAPDAQELFVEWLTALEAKVRSGELHPALVSHLSKYRSLMPSLALLFELADAVARGEAGDGDTVSLDHARQAAAWCSYRESHARRVYSCIVTPQIRSAIELAGKIRHKKIGADGFFSPRDVYLKGWSALDSPEAVTRAAEVLQDAGWIRPIGSQSADPLGRGRPSVRYEINPGIFP